MAKKEGAKTSAGSSNGGPDFSTGPSLVICRNKHWRHISSYHGPWLQLPPEILASLAHQNYTMPQPRLIDPAVFYDIVKIRRAVDEATEDAVRASTGLSASQSNSSLGRLDPWGTSGGTGPKMSKERVFKIRQKAVKLLAKAYTLDEVAASVATMQSTSSLEDVAQHVLKRDRTDHDANYVHFYHEKIPSRMMEHYTPLQPLTDIVMGLPWEARAAPLRTRALVQIFKGEYEGSARDFTLALQVAQELKLRHKPGADQLVLARQYKKEEHDSWNRNAKDWRNVPQLADEEQPSSMEQQLLFNRAGVYLSIACQSVHDALDGLPQYQKKMQSGVELSAAEREAHAIRLEARKRVKTCARRALKDYLAFLSFFEYTPGLPFEITNEIMRRVYDLANGNKLQNYSSPAQSRLTGTNGDASSQDSSSTSGALVKHQSNGHQDGSGLEFDADGWPRFPLPQIHPASALFAATPPQELPEFPVSGTSVSSRPRHDSPLSSGSREAITYHPLLTDALHSLLLTHALLQTSSTELLRHAHNAARLARITDGYPIFQAARAPARADWIEVLRRADNWIGLSHSWQKLCQPAPLPSAAGGDFQTFSPGNEDGAKPDVLRKTADESEEHKRERIKQQAIIDSLGDERVVDEESFQRAVRARERRALQDEGSPSGQPGDTVNGSVNGECNPNGHGRNGISDENGQWTPKRWAQDDGKEYPISTERAEAIARWIKEAPLSVGIKKKKRPAKKKSSKSDSVKDATSGMTAMHVDDNAEEEELD